MIEFCRYAVRAPNGQMTLRFDSWYALNVAAGNGGDPDGDFTKGPFRKYPSYRAPSADGDIYDWRIHKLSDFKNASELAFVYDGILWGTRSTFLSLRHDFGKSVNILMADGHAENVRAERLPQTFSEADQYIGYPKFILRP